MRRVYSSAGTLVLRVRQADTMSRGILKLLRNAAHRAEVTRKLPESFETSLETLLFRYNLASAISSGILVFDAVAEYLQKSQFGTEQFKADTEAEYVTRIRNYTREQAAKKARLIAENLRTEIAELIARAIEDGLAEGAIASEISEMSGFALSHSRTIARTETAQAIMHAESEAVLSDPDMSSATKEWVSTNDERTRESHREANGQTVVIDEKFNVGGVELMHPSDPEGPPEEVINCRCGVVYGF